MKRYLILFLIFMLLVPCLVVPASATTQGVINAIEDLTEGLGTSQGDIRDLLEDIDLWIYECYSMLAEISTTLYDSIWEGYCLPVYDYFFTPNKSTTVYTIIRVSSGYKLVTATVNDTGFKCDIIHTITNSLTTIEFYIRQFLTGDTTVSDAVQDQVNQDSTEASEILDVMDDVTKPDVGELEDLSDISGYVNAGDVNVLAACLSPFFQSAIFLPCIMLSLIFMLVAYVLYGKR